MGMPTPYPLPVPVFHAFALVSHTNSSDTELHRKLNGYILLLSLGVLFNILHFAFWLDLMNDNKKNLMVFSKYQAEFNTGATLVSNWDSQLFLPLMIMFLFIEPMVGIVSYGLLVLSYLMEYGMPVRRGNMYASVPSEQRGVWAQKNPRP